VNGNVAPEDGADVEAVVVAGCTDAPVDEALATGSDGAEEELGLDAEELVLGALEVVLGALELGGGDPALGVVDASGSMYCWLPADWASAAAGPASATVTRRATAPST
jgi:hypothetical protein